MLLERWFSAAALEFHRGCCAATEEEIEAIEAGSVIKEGFGPMYNGELVEAEFNKIAFQGKSAEGNARDTLLSAVCRDDAPGVVHLIADGQVGEYLGEALRLAAERGACNVVRELAKVGVDVDEVCPKTGFAPIHFAARGGFSDACEYLLEATASVLIRVRGETPLSMARKAGQIEAEEVIVRHLAQVAYWDTGLEEDALHLQALRKPRRSSSRTSNRFPLRKYVPCEPTFSTPRTPRGVGILVSEERVPLLDVVRTEVMAV